MTKATWEDRDGGRDGAILNNQKGKVFISYQPNKIFEGQRGYTDSSNPETAIVLIGDKPDGRNRYLIYRGDRRKDLENLYPNISKLKKHWKQHGGHFWSDSLED